MMKLYSTNRLASPVSLREAVWRGLAEDGGLFLPVEFPKLPPRFFKEMDSLSFQEICFEVARSILQEEIPHEVLGDIIREAICFDAPLIRLSEELYVLGLFHGPTLAFKDFGARFMARVLSYLARDSDKPLTVIVATSGDTGSAIAHGFLGLAGIRVVILYPAGRVSEIQEKQFATLGQNIVALEVAGSFDDCQRFAKQALADPELAEKLSLTSANSINIARLLPQTFYYFRAYAQLKDKHTPVVFSVPCGNFGNLTAGLVAKKMGLPVSRFIAATNVNDVVPEYLRTGLFSARASRKTLATAMDVGNPSNFARMLALYEHDVDQMRTDVWGRGYGDEEVQRAIGTVFRRHGCLLDPHSAIGYLGWESYAREQNGVCQGIFLATAHPAKFADVVERAAGTRVVMPERLAACLKATKRSIPLPNRFTALKEFLLSGLASEKPGRIQENR